MMSTKKPDALEERLIDAEYKIWKKNTPYLYDFVMTHALEWPSLTCQWLPVSKQLDKMTEHSLLIGTHTTGDDDNFLMIGSVNLPSDDAVIDARSPAASYDEERKELGGFGHGNSSVGKITIKLKVKHEGEVNRARYMPQNHFIVASRGPRPEVYIWDLTKHPSFPTDPASPFSPQGVCVGHTAEGYGIEWSPHSEGKLITCSEDKTVRLFDIGALSSSNGTQLQSISTFKGHTSVVEDVAWHPKDPNMIASCGDDRQLLIWDVREKDPAAPVHFVKDAHDGDINCLAFNPVNEFVLATGSADKAVALWDMRNLKSRLQTLAGHTDQVYQVEWAGFNESILGSCSADRRVAIWDLGRIGMEQTPEDAEDGPPELLFIHGGHTSKVSDFSFNSKDEWTIASVSEDNVLQIWHMAEEIYTEEDDDDMSGTGEGEDQLLANENDLE